MLYELWQLKFFNLIKPSLFEIIPFYSIFTPCMQDFLALRDYFYFIHNMYLCMSCGSGVWVEILCPLVNSPNHNKSQAWPSPKLGCRNPPQFLKVADTQVRGPFFDVFPDNLEGTDLEVEQPILVRSWYHRQLNMLCHNTSPSVVLSHISEVLPRCLPPSY